MTLWSKSNRNEICVLTEAAPPDWPALSTGHVTHRRPKIFSGRGDFSLEAKEQVVK